MNNSIVVCIRFYTELVTSTVGMLDTDDTRESISPLLPERPFGVLREERSLLLECREPGEMSYVSNILLMGKKYILYTHIFPKSTFPLGKISP